jgi:hypothetical protein
LWTFKYFMVTNKKQKHRNPKKYWSQIRCEWKHVIHSRVTQRPCHFSGRHHRHSEGHHKFRLTSTIILIIRNRESSMIISYWNDIYKDWHVILSRRFGKLSKNMTQWVYKSSALSLSQCLSVDLYKNSLFSRFILIAWKQIHFRGMKWKGSDSMDKRDQGISVQLYMFHIFSKFFAEFVHSNWISTSCDSFLYTQCNISNG